MSQQNKMIVQRLVEEVMNGGQLDVIDELFSPSLAPEAKQWIAPFRDAFPDVHMDVVDLIAEADTVVGHFTCSATRFVGVDEVSIFRIRDGKIVHTWAIEDTLERMKQLGLA